MKNSKSNSYDPILLLRAVLGEKGRRQYNINVAKRLGSVDYAVILSDLIDEYIHFHEENKLISNVKYGDCLMFYSIERAYDRTGVKRYAFEKALKMFTEMGFLSTIAKFGNQGRKHFNLDVSRICDWFFSKTSLQMQKPASGVAETCNSSCRNQHQTNLINESKKETKKRSFPLHMKKDSVFSRSSFNPKTYKLRNGKELSLIMQRTLMKNMKDPEKRRQILENVKWYEDQIDKGIEAKRGHEVLLQWAIKTDVAAKINQKEANAKYAKIMKDEFKLEGMEIKKTVVTLDKKDGNRPESISLDLDRETFRNILERYLEKIN